MKALTSEEDKGAEWSPDAFEQRDAGPSLRTRGLGQAVQRPYFSGKANTGNTTLDIDSGPDKIFFATGSSDSTYEQVKENLERRGIGVEQLRPEDVEKEGDEFFLNGEKASELDANIYLRPKRWTDIGDSWEGMAEFIDLQREEDIGFYGDPQSAVLAEDKKATKNVFESQGIGTVDDFEYDEALEKIEDGEELVVKPRFNSSCGDGIEAVSTEKELENYQEEIIEDEFLVEEKMDHGRHSANADMRMVITGDEAFRAQRVDGDGLANNIDNNGEYTRPGTMSWEESRLEQKASEILGDGFYSIDYVMEADGSVNVMEVNSSSHTEINEQLAGDLYDSIAEGIVRGDYQHRELSSML